MEFQVQKLNERERECMCVCVDWAEWGWEMALRRKLSPVLEIKLSSFIRVLLYNYVPSIV